MTIGSRVTNPSSQPVRVVHVVTTLAIGGLEKVVLDLVRCRTRNTFSMHVIGLDSAGVLAQRFADSGVPVEVIGTAGAVPSRILRLARRLAQLRPDVVHTHNPQAHVHGALAARLARVPAVVHTRHGREHMDRMALAMASRLASHWTDQMVAVSADAAGVAQSVEGVHRGKLRVIHNGIDLSRFAIRRADPAQLPRRAVTVGRLDPVKDHRTMIMAARLVVNEMPGFRLDIVGDGPLRQELEALRNSLGLCNEVRFLGYHDQVDTFLTTSDLFLLSSVSEGVPLALLEAMATGLPAVATDVGGIREVILRGETGTLVRPGSPADLAAAILASLADPAQLAQMGVAGRRRVEAAFDLRSMVNAYEGLYLQCLGRPQVFDGQDVQFRPTALSG